MAACEAAVGYTSDDEEALQLDYDEVCDEVVEIQAELRAEQIEVQQLLMRLKAESRSGGSQGGAAGGTSTLPAVRQAVEEQRAEELRRLFRWLAEHADLSRPEIMDVGFEVPIAGRTVLLQRVVQWPLPGAPGGQLRVTAPIEHKEPLGNLLAATRASGIVDAEAILHFLSGWDLIAGELTTAALKHPEPSVLLSQRTSTQGILVATWPTREALQAIHTVCPLAPRLGEKVEVNYEGTWYAGVLHSVDANGLASIRCDADPPGVLTVTPLSHVRRLVPPPESASAPTVVGSSGGAAATDSAEVAAAAAAASAVAQSEFDRFSQVSASTKAVSTSGFSQPWVKGHRRTRSSAL